nr:hypothetical protein [Tanacetum cinerariifolium]
MVVIDDHDMIDTGDGLIRRDVIETGECSIPTDVLDVGKGSNTKAYEEIDFGRHLYGLDHMKSRNMITAELEIGEYDWQTAMVRPYAGTSEGAHGACFWKYVIRFAIGKRTGQDKMNGTLM